MGDGSFYRILTNLSTCRDPLVEMSGPPQVGQRTVTITHAGRDVIKGRADHIELNGVDTWLGGVYMKGDTAAWRWDRPSCRLVAG